MARISAWALAALLMLPMYAKAAEPCGRGQVQQPRPQQQASQPDPKNGRGDQHQPPAHWWIDPQLRQQLAITDAQSKAVEDIWQKSLPDLRKLWHQLNALEDQVSKMIQDGAPEAAVTAQIEQTENTRAQANKARTLLIYRMYNVLKPEQRVKVTEIAPPLYERRDGRRGGGPK
jgi:Spy/CpxP family protein refolding chaperone